MDIRWWVCLYWWQCIIKSTLKGNGNSEYQYKTGRLNTYIFKYLQNNLLLAPVIKKLPLIKNLQKSFVQLLIQETGYKYRHIINVNLVYQIFRNEKRITSIMRYWRELKALTKDTVWNKTGNVRIMQHWGAFV